MSIKEDLINKKIGRAIAKRRKGAGFTQEEVADHLGISLNSVSRLETGQHSPGIYRLYLLADLFECGVDSFLIEGSRRASDQAEYLTKLLMKNSPADRSVILSVVEKLSKHMSKCRPEE